MLFLRGVSPWSRVGNVTDLAGTVVLARRLLYANRERADQVTTGAARRGEETWVYGRAGLPCRRCGALVEREARPDGDERVTDWCPHCQPRPGDTLRPGRREP